MDIGLAGHVPGHTMLARLLACLLPWLLDAIVLRAVAEVHHSTRSYHYDL